MAANLQEKREDQSQKGGAKVIIGQKDKKSEMYVYTSIQSFLTSFPTRHHSEKLHTTKSE